MASTSLVPAFTPEPKICVHGGHGVVLPFSDNEHEWDNGARSFIYLLMLGWCFLGVAIISDIFMESIEAVTSKRRQWKLSNGTIINYKVWNDTVANLSLMALGSSAPEIMLNVIEICLRGFFSGDLGPSVIVGSAAFNLMVIIAVCVFVIPDNETRTIKSVEPFLVTAFFSIFAYLWMVICVSGFSPDIVTIPEACVTLMFFPVLLLTAYAADVGMFNCKKDSKEEDERVAFIQQKAMEAGYNLTEKETRKLANMKTVDLGGKSAIALRVAASPVVHHGMDKKELSLGFITAKYEFHHGDTDMVLTVEKFGENPAHLREMRVVFEYKTLDGTNMREADGDYNAVSGFGEISPGDLYGKINVSRKAGMPSPEDGVNGALAKKARLDTKERSFFYVEIVSAHKIVAHDHHHHHHKKSGATAQASEELTHAGLQVHIVQEVNRAQVAVADIGGPGLLQIDGCEVDVPYPEVDTVARVKVRRINGSEGEIACQFYIEDESAKAGIDYIAVEGELYFSAGVVEKVIEVPVMRKADPETQDQFVVVLAEIPGRPTVLVDGQNRCTVTIFDEESDGVEQSYKVLRALDSAFNVGAVIDGGRVWADQFVAAFNPRGGDDDDRDQATPVEWTLHLVSLPWKVLFAFTPPPSYCGGWACFFVALLLIGAITIFIGDLATLLGCVMNINSMITAITIVALGTSLPDLFASKTSAVEDPSADAAIGNVTGSNSVNVFLGLGLPWVFGSFYWHFKGKTPEWEYRYPELSLKYSEAGLVVLGGDLAFSVCVFTVCALCVLAVLWYRRHAFQAEMGGPVGVKTNTSIFLVLLWIFYVSMASWKVIAGDAATTGKCLMALLVGFLCVILGMGLVAGGMAFMQYSTARRRAEMKELFEEIQKDHDVSLGIVPVSSEKPNKAQRRSAPPQEPSKLGSVSPDPGGGFPSLDAAEQLLAGAPALAEGLRWKLPEAIASLREHLEALNSVCSSLELGLKTTPASGSLEAAEPGKDAASAGWTKLWDDSSARTYWQNDESGEKRYDEAGATEDGGDGFDEEGRGSPSALSKSRQNAGSTVMKKKRLKKVPKTPSTDDTGAQAPNDNEGLDLLDSFEKDAAQ